MSWFGTAVAGPVLSKKIRSVTGGGSGDTWVITVFEKLLSSAASAVLPRILSSMVLSGSTTDVFSRSPDAAAATLPLTVIVALAPALTRPLMHVTVWPLMVQV